MASQGHVADLCDERSLNELQSHNTLCVWTLLPGSQGFHPVSPSSFLSSMRLNNSPRLEALVLPRPQLPQCRSSLSSLSSSPRTPQSPSRRSSFIFSPANRNSTDSWNSSNGPDDLEWDWKPDQVRLLTRVLLFYFILYFILSYHPP